MLTSCSHGASLLTCSASTEVKLTPPSRRNANGTSGLELVLAQVAHLLQPGASESGGLFVGDLVLHLIRTASASLGPVLPDLLKAFVTRLATAETASFSQVRGFPHFICQLHTNRR